MVVDDPSPVPVYTNTPVVCTQSQGTQTAGNKSVIK